MKTKQLSPEALEALTTATFEGDVVRFPNQLDRKIYVEVNKALEALGGKWNRGKMGHVFSGIPHTAQKLVEDLLAAEGYVDKKKELGQFFTPAKVADLLVKLADVHVYHQVLEPSAGQGAIVAAIARRAPRCALTAVEIDTANIRALHTTFNGPGYCLADHIVCHDFLKLPAAHAAFPFAFFDRIIMNPPFAKGAAIDHVMHAWKFLQKGGRLVSILDAGVMFRSARADGDFRRFVEKHSAITAMDVTHAIEIGASLDETGCFLMLPENTFAESGTGVRTVIVVLEKPR